MARHAARRRPGRHRRGPSAARRRQRSGAVAVLLVGGLCSIGLAAGGAAPPRATGVEGDAVPAGIGSLVRHAPDPTRAEPVRLEVRAVDIHVDLVQLGLAPDGSLEVPAQPMSAGWYAGSPTPGQPGPAVIVGHVDSETGPAVFHRLGELTVGSRVEALLDDGRVAEFEVSAVRSYPKSRFPRRAVYGNTDGSTLRLVTCGSWNPRTEQYDDNVVVFAELVSFS